MVGKKQIYTTGGLADRHWVWENPPFNVCVCVWSDINVEVGGMIQLQLVANLLSITGRIQSSAVLRCHQRRLMSVSVPHYASSQRRLASSQQVTQRNEGVSE